MKPRDTRTQDDCLNLRTDNKETESSWILLHSTEGDVTICNQKTGEAPTEMWELATVATGIIQRQLNELSNLRRIAQNPAVQALIAEHRQQAIDDSTARQEHEWRSGRGHGAGGQRHTGD